MGWQVDRFDESFALKALLAAQHFDFDHNPSPAVTAEHFFILILVVTTASLASRRRCRRLGWFGWMRLCSLRRTWSGWAKCRTVRAWLWAQNAKGNRCWHAALHSPGTLVYPSVAESIRATAIQKSELALWAAALMFQGAIPPGPTAANEESK